MSLLPIGGVAIALVAAFLGGQWRGYSREHDAKVREIATITAEIEGEREVWTQMMIDLGSELTREAQDVQTGLETTLLDRSKSLVGALERLRLAERSKPTPAKPANTAPAECRSYEATPGMLPLRDRELLLGLLDEADRGMLERAACTELYGAARQAIAGAKR